MKLTDLNPVELAQLAERAGTSGDYLRHVAKGRRQASITMAVALEQATRGAIPRESLIEECQKCKYRRTCVAKEQA